MAHSKILPLHSRDKIGEVSINASYRNINFGD
jgi:hypothetical protein